MQQDTKKGFTDLKKFLVNNFHTKEELKKELEQFATKKDINNLTNSVDAYAKQSRDYRDEVLALQEQVTTMQQWIIKVSTKVGIAYKP